MHTILIAIEDAALRDLVRTAAKHFPTLHPVAVPRDEAPRILRDISVASALVVDYQRDRRWSDPLIEAVREVNSDVTILAVGERPDRDRFNQVKVDLRVFTFIPLPLDPFDLARRLHRLVESMGRGAA